MPPVQMPPVQMSPPFKKRKLARSSTLEDELDVNDDDDDEVDAPSWLKLFNLDHRALVMPTGEKEDWVPQSKEIAYKIKARDVKHVVWWDVSRLHPSPVDMYRLAHLPYAHDTGLFSCVIDEEACTTMAAYLDNPDNYSDDGWLIFSGQTYPGYSRYPYVHASIGQLPSVQEVCAHSPSDSSSSDVSHFLFAVPQRKTVRVSGKTACDNVLAGAPEVRKLLSAVRKALGLPELRRTPDALRPAQSPGKCVRAMHFLMQDASEQASFTWHDDATDIGADSHMTTVIVSLSKELSGMRIWGFRPHLFNGMGSAAVFAGAALHESLPRHDASKPVRKVAFFFA